MALDQPLAGEPRQQIAHLRREMIRRGLRQRIEREGGAAVGSRRAAQTEIDPAGRDRLQHAELLGHLQAGIVRQHDAGGADADARGGGGDGADQDFRRRAGLAGRVVVLGAPVARVAKRLAMLRQRQALADRGVRRAAGHHGRLVEDGQSQHAIAPAALEHDQTALSDPPHHIGLLQRLQYRIGVRRIARLHHHFQFRRLH